MTLTRSTLLGFASAALGGAAVAAGRSASAQTGSRMHQRRFPASGEMLPVVGLRHWRTFDVGNHPAERAPLAEVLNVLFEAGRLGDRHLADVRRGGGVVGDLLPPPHARKAFIATKVWTSGRNNGIEQIRGLWRCSRPIAST